MGHRRKREEGLGLGRAPPTPWSELDKERRGAAPLSFSFSLSFLSPFSLLVVPTRNRIAILFLVGLLLLGAPIGAGQPSALLLYIRGQGAPKDTQVELFQPCAVPPSTETHLGHTVAVLRRSPAPVTSSYPSPRRRADETLP